MTEDCASFFSRKRLEDRLVDTPIDESQVRHVAQLARLKLSDDEIRQHTVDLVAILGYVEQLSELNTDGIAETTHPLPLCNVLRDDEPQPSLTPDQALANAPQKRDTFFGVPKVLNQEGG